MHAKLLTGILSAALVSVAAAQTTTTSSTGVVTPSVPAPAVSAPVAPAPSETNAVTQLVYSPKLPTAAELRTAAEAQGMKLERVVQTQIQVIAFYRDASGKEVTVAYQTVPPSGSMAAPTAAPVVVQTQQPATVVYETAPRVVYYDDYYPYYAYPRAYYPPVSLSLGFGFGRGYYRGGYGGGFHHWR